MHCWYLSRKQTKWMINHRGEKGRGNKLLLFQAFWSHCACGCQGPSGTSQELLIKATSHQASEHTKVSSLRFLSLRAVLWEFHICLRIFVENQDLNMERQHKSRKVLSNSKYLVHIRSTYSEVSLRNQYSGFSEEKQILTIQRMRML